MRRKGKNFQRFYPLFFKERPYLPWTWKNTTVAQSTLIWPFPHAPQFVPSQLCSALGHSCWRRPLSQWSSADKCWRVKFFSHLKKHNNSMFNQNDSRRQKRYFQIPVLDETAVCRFPFGPVMTSHYGINYTLFIFGNMETLTSIRKYNLINNGWF